MGDSFVWQLAGSGAWNTALNWTDTTQGAVATRPPAAGDVASYTGPADGIEFGLLSGGGAATSFTVSGNGALGRGSFNFGTLATNSSNGGTLALLAGVAVTAGSLSINGSVGVTNATLAVTGQIGGSYGNLTASNHATITAGSITFNASYGGISVDPTSVLEVGTAGGAAAGTITVDAGATLTTNAELSGPVLDQGTIKTIGGASLNISNAVTGTGVVLIASSFLFLEGSVSASNTITFATGTTGTLAVSGILPAATITGFLTGDAIEIENTSVSGAAYNAGILTLRGASGANVGTLALTGNFTGESFAVVNAGGYGESLVYLASGTIGAGSVAPSSGTTANDDYLWNSTVGGDWGAVGNWNDTSATTTTTAAGINDFVTINGSTKTFQVVSGQGNAASLTIYGKVALGGLFHTSQLTVGGSSDGTLVVEGMGVSAASATIGNGTLVVSASTLSVAGTLTNSGQYSGGIISVENGGTITAGGISEISGSAILVDATSAFEIGAAGNAANGDLTVDAGITAALSGSIYGGLVDNGIIVANGSLIVLGAVGGSGRLVVGAATYGAGYALQSTVGSGVTLDFANVGTVSDKLSGFAGTIAEFGPGDALTDNAETFNAASYSATGANVGVLTLSENGTSIARLSLLGNFASDSFIVRQFTSGTFNASSVLVDAGTAGAGSIAAGPGTAGADNYSWTPTLGGSWNTASNWTDTTAGTTAAIAPGSLDLVTINGGTIGQIVSGQGKAASLTLSGTLALGGIFTAGTIGGTVATLDINSGAVTSTGDAGLGSARLLNVAGTGALVVAGTLSLAAVNTLGGGLVRAGNLVGATYAGTLQTDSVSTIEIGTTAGAAGVITVGSGATVAGGFVFASAVVDNGLIASGAGADIVFEAGVSGSGTIAVGAGSTAIFSNSVSASTTIVLGAGASLSVQATGAPVSFASFGQAGGGVLAGPIVGYAAGDRLAVNGATFDTAGYTGTAAGGTLTLSYDGTAVGTLMLQGNYLGDSFIVAPTSFGSEAIAMVLACFAAGTCLDTPCGNVAVEALQVGSLVMARTGPARIRWIGSTRVDPSRHPDRAKVAPVRILAGAFGHGLPRRDLLLSPDHAVALVESGETVLVPIHLLINGATIRQELDHPALTYFHIELEHHEILFAEGLPSESYLDTGNRDSLTPDGAIVPLHPRFVPDGRDAVLRIWADQGCAPLLLEGGRLEALHAGLLAEAERRFEVSRQTPQPILTVAGRRVMPEIAAPEYLCFIVPAGARQVTLVSPVAAVSWFDRGAQDHRLLGLAVSHIQHEGVAIELAAMSGCHDAEAGWRWTRGAAKLDLPGEDRETILEFRLQPTGLRHWPHALGAARAA